jgi:hypothetical protein
LRHFCCDAVKVVWTRNPGTLNLVGEAGDTVKAVRGFMTDVVLELPVSTGEDLLFGAYVSRFMEVRANDVERCAASSDAPYLMIRSDPAVGDHVRIVTFQEPAAASEFSNGWARERTGIKTVAA